MSTNFPHNDNDFHALMLEVDREIANEGYSISRRPLIALSKIAKRFQIPLEITPKKSPQQNPSISDKVLTWYDTQFGNRLKMNMSIGRMVFSIQNDLWIARFPTIFGSADILNEEFMRKSFKDLSAERWKTFTKNDVHTIRQLYSLGYSTFSLLTQHINQPLIKSALVDSEAAVEQLASDRYDYGLSKWSSLQFSEKIMKASILHNGGKIRRSHDLSKLAKDANNVGLQGSWDGIIHHIQCSPGIRYNDETCTKEEALIAHHNSIHLVAQLHQSGAKFKPNRTTI
ncbi:HEPN domain-containing protein [Lujinxingia vulgaris]|nr:HEPN domain-containing protein [Lujinxingia vulgaris]